MSKAERDTASQPAAGLESSAPIFENALTWRPLSSIVFAAFVIQPVVIYNYLVNGSWLPFQGWIVILLWSEIARHMGSPLNVGEIFMITAFGGIMGAFGGITGGWGALPMRFALPLFRMYIGTTEYAQFFGITDAMPSWWAPGPKLAAQLYYEQWVLFDLPVWGINLLVIVLSVVLSTVANISIGYICYHLYVRVERLGFPVATAEAQTVVTIAEREPQFMRVLMLSALIGTLYNGVTSFIPFIIGPLITGVGYVPTPLGIDFTPLIAPLMPGATFVVPTGLMNFVPGFILPVGVTVVMFAGALAYYFFGSYIITTLHLWPAEAQPQTIISWAAATVVDRSNLYFFNSTTIGLALSLAVIPLVLHPRLLKRAFSSLAQAARTGGEGPSVYMLLGLFLASALGAVVLNLALVPDFLPYWWIVVFYIVGWSFLASFVSTMSAGVTLGGFNVPYQRELMIYYSGFQGKSVWFAPMEAFTGGAGIAAAFRQSDICRVKHTDYLKVFIFVVAISLFSSFIFVNLFWRIQPFPSGAYPYTVAWWPIEALNFSRTREWMWTGFLFRDQYILGAFIVGAVAYAILDLGLHSAWGAISFLAGSGSGIPMGLGLLVGSVIGNKIIARQFGRESWFKYRPLIMIGMLLGDTFMYGLSVALWLIKKAMWLLPY